jgi:hypothetical protein
MMMLPALGLQLLMQPLLTCFLTRKIHTKEQAGIKKQPTFMQKEWQLKKSPFFFNDIASFIQFILHDILEQNRKP